MGNIGIGITTHNRYEIFRETYLNLLKFLPENAILVVIDDASDIPVNEANFRFNKQVGIARAKNKCLELLQNCEHIFLFDDDIYPLNKDWYKPYINSGYNHMCLSFEKNVKGQMLSNKVFVTQTFNSMWVYNQSNGLMLYFNRKCIDKVGGYDTSYGIWGMEHLDISKRIYNAGLTPYPFMDIPNSIDNFYSHDYYNNVESSVPIDIRIDSISRNTEYYNRNKLKSKYIPLWK